MPGMTSQQYLSKAQKNGQFARNLQASNVQYPEWVVVGAFYSALHYVNAYLVKSNPKLIPNDHRNRMFFVNSEKELKQISRFYQRLSNKAWAARYTMVSGFNRGFSQELIDKDLTSIENHLRPLLQ